MSRSAGIVRSLTCLACIRFLLSTDTSACMYSRGLPTRITLGYHYVRLQYLFNAYCSNLCVSVLLLTLPTNWHCALAGLPVPLQDTALRPQAHLFDC